MSPKQEHVERELLTIAFRATPRGATIGFVFAALSVGFMWGALPQPLLVSWLGLFALLALMRVALARAFLRSIQPAASFAGWTRLSAASYGVIGFFWGALGAAAIHYAFEHREFLMWIGFLIVVFSSLQSQTTGNKPPVVRAFIAGAGLPLIATAIAEPSPNYHWRLVAIPLVLAIAAIAARIGNRTAEQSIAMRYENIELLQELTRQKEALDRANAAKTRFLAAASHDLRQPMQAVVLLVESLGERVHEPGVRRIVDNISSSVTAMSTLLNEILDISRFDAGAVKPQRTTVAIEEVLQRLRTSFAEPAARKGLVLRVRPCGAFVDTDPVLLYRLLCNLVHNAVRYTNRGGVLVGCRPRMDGVSIEVWDSGVGIGPTQIHEIFREFYQVDNPQRDRDQGLGLGLAIVERTARVLEHPISVRSRLGRGSVFSVLVRYGDAARAQPPAPARAALPLHGCTVLVIEDSREIREAMAALLDGWGCLVIAAVDGAEAEARARDRELHAIVADYNLPGGENGIAVLQRLARRHPQAQRVLISGDIDPGVLRAAGEAGIPLLHKPLRPARLRAMLGAAWRGARAEAAE
jgi:signal transduction histidine kinase